MNDEKVIQSAGTNLSASQLLARSAIPFDEACVKVIQLEKQRDMLLRAAKSAKEFFDSDGDISDNSEKEIISLINAAIKQVESENSDSTN